MKRISILLFFAIFSCALYSQECNSYGDAQIDLHVNNVKARLLNSGDLWWDGADGKYIAPAKEQSFLEVSAIYAGALWFGGTNPNGDLKLAAQRYRFDNRTDFFPGPLKLGADSPTGDDCENWDRFWVVNKSDVDDHIADYNDNNKIDNPNPNVYSWPGKNNPSFMDNNGFELPADHSLAPFFDKDGNGDYNPDQGDYPLIKGDQSIWWVFNDLAGNHNVSFSSPMAIEVQAMAYAEASLDENINNATYYDFKITNQGTEDLIDSYMGLWVDFDLGCPDDDYMGYDEEYQMMYAYNQDILDGNGQGFCPSINTYAENIPMIGIRQINNANNPVSSFHIYNRGEPFLDGPDLDFEYYNILRGFWKDGIAMTYGGLGFDPASTDSVSYLFTGDPSDENAWSMCTTNLPFYDRKCVMSTSMKTLQPGQSFTNTYAVIFVENVEHPCPSLDKIKEAADAVTNNVVSSNENVIQALEIEISPNPAYDFLNINSDQPIQNIQVLNINGQVLIDQYNGNNTASYILNLQNLNDGFYFVCVKGQSGSLKIEKFIIQRR